MKSDRWLFLRWRNRTPSPKLGKADLDLIEGSERAGSRITKSQAAAIIVIVIAYVGLFSHWWYPLSDSSLYLALARNIVAGRGYSYMDAPHRMVPPMMPLFLSGIMLISHSFALLNAIMVILALASLVLCYAVLRQWLGHNWAILLTLVTAICYWYFRLATVVMSDQLFLCLLWAALLFLGKWRRTQPGQGEIRWLICAVIFLALAFATRVSSILLVPGLVLAIWFDLRSRRAKLGQQFVACAVLVVPMALLIGSYLLWRDRPGPPARESFSLVAARDHQNLVLAMLESPDSKNGDVDSPENNIPANPQLTIPLPAVPVPSGQGIIEYSFETTSRSRSTLAIFYNAGRWMAEALVAPSAYLFDRYPRSFSSVVVVPLAVLGLAGIFKLFRERRWWLLWAIPYCIFVWWHWSGRIKPRYMMPVLPFLLLWLLLGIDQIVVWLASLTNRTQSDKVKCWSRRLQGLFVTVIVLCNIPILAAEIYYRHQSDFYGSIRQGAYAGLVDVSAYIREELPPDIIVYTNDVAHRREIHLMTGRRVAILPTGIRSPKDRSNIRKFFNESGAHYAVLYFGKRRRWPVWHFSRNDSSSRKDTPWYSLYIRDAGSDRLTRMFCPPARDWFSRVPTSGI